MGESYLATVVDER